MLVSDSGLDIANAFGALGSLGAQENLGIGDDWCVSLWRTGDGGSIQFAALYLDHAIGITGVNVAKLQSLSAFLRSQGFPFIITGDFNHELVVLLASGWPQAMGVEIVVPMDCVLVWVRSIYFL